LRRPKLPVKGGSAPEEEEEEKEEEFYTDFVITSALLSGNNCFNMLFVINYCL